MRQAKKKTFMEGTFMKIRSACIGLVVAALLSASAFGQSQDSTGGGGSAGGCVCGTTEAGEGFCFDPRGCGEVQVCGPGAPPCPAGETCLVDTCCGAQPTCGLPCPQPGNCPVGGTCTAGFPLCEAAPVPTVSEWGLVVLTLIGCIAGSILFAAARRRAQPTA